MKQLNQTSTVQWIPCLRVQWHPMPGGIATTCTERLPGSFDTHHEAMEAAENLAHQRPDAIGISAKRVEVQQ